MPPSHRAPLPTLVPQLSALDSIATPAAGLRCVLRSWDALLGVLGVWSKHAQAHDFMPLMAYVIIQAAPKRLISQLHFVRSLPSPAAHSTGPPQRSPCQPTALHLRLVVTFLTLPASP